MILQNQKDFIGKKILALAESHTACYAMHTNFDVLAMADINEKLLGLKDTEVLMVTGEDQEGHPRGIGRVGMLEPAMDLESCARFVKERFDLPGVKVCGDLKKMIHRAAVSGGAGKSMVTSAVSSGAQVLITGDIDHHTALDAADQGLCIIDAGHYGIEHIFIADLKSFVERNFPELTIYTEAVRQPFLVV